MLKKRLALVTGANKGLGFETARQIARKSVKTLLAARDEAKGRQSAEKLRSEGLDVEFIHLDVTDSDMIRRAASHVEKTFGRLDILVNNAGITLPEEPLFANSTEVVSRGALRRIFDVNFFGLVEVTQSLLSLLKKSDAGRIVNVSSILGSLSLQSGDGDMAAVKPFAYDASKAAINAFTIHLAASLKNTPIKVNSAHPGWVRTDLGGEQAPLAVEEGALTMVRLAFLEADGPTGKFFNMENELPW